STVTVTRSPTVHAPLGGIEPATSGGDTSQVRALLMERAIVTMLVMSAAGAPADSAVTRMCAAVSAPARMLNCTGTTKSSAACDSLAPSPGSGTATVASAGWVSKLMT